MAEIPITTGNRQPARTAIQQEIVDLVGRSEARLTSRDVLVRLSGGVGRPGARFLKKAVSDLVVAGALRYVNDCGASFLEQNYLGRVLLSPHVWLNTNTTPQRVGAEKWAADPTEGVEICLLPGIAFGDCRHPTTRMAVAGLDFLLTDYGFEKKEGPALDIGTGSGILALTMAGLGVSNILATDIDPCARKEARDNLCRNHMAERVRVSDRPLETITERFSLICANLRMPTLKRMAAEIEQKTVTGAAAVFSGVKKEEADTLLAIYKEAFDCIWKAFDGGWFGAVFIKSK